MAVIPRSEYPRPQLIRDRWVCLNGPWQFEIDPGASGRERGWQSGKDFGREIILPFCPESELSGIGHKDFMNCVWYRRRVDAPAEWAGHRMLLHVGACDYETNLYVNGRHAASHRGGYTPITADVTDLMTEGANEIVIKARDDVRSYLQPAGKQCPAYHSRGCSYTRTTGIWQTVWMEPVPATYIRATRLVPSLESGTLTVTFLPGGTRQPYSIVARASAGGEVVAHGSARASGGSAAVLTLTLDDPQAWEIGNPFLYDLELQLTSAGGADTVQGYFGLRDVGTEGRKLTLNSRPLFMRTVLDQGFYPDGIYTAPTDAALKADIEMSQAMGFDGARLHQKVFEPRFLYWADRLGYYVWDEFPSWVVNINDPRGVHAFVEEWLEVLRRDVNHPSVIGWCPLNETRGSQSDHSEWLHRTLYEMTRAIDPSRLAIDTSGYVHHPGVGTDLYDVHNYGEPEGLAATLEGLKEGRWAEAFRNYERDVPYDGSIPYFVSECGGIWWNPGQNDDKAWGYGDRPAAEKDFIDRYRRTIDILLNNPNVCGFCYTQLTDIEQEVNGLYTYDRRPKFAPDVIRDINQAAAAIELD